jgi:mRNA interferase MazF
VTFEGKESKAMADQLATISKSRPFRSAGITSQDDMLKIEEAIKIQLDIN